MSEHGIARWSRWAEGTWTAAVAPHGVLLLPPKLSEEFVTDLWEELRSSRGSLTAILDHLVMGAGGHLSKIPDFALVVAASDGVRIAARGQVGLEIDGESVEAHSVATWREIFLPGSPKIIVRAPEPTGPVLRPVVDAVLTASAVFPGQMPDAPDPEEPAGTAHDAGDADDAGDAGSADDADEADSPGGADGAGSAGSAGSADTAGELPSNGSLSGLSELSTSSASTPPDAASPPTAGSPGTAGAVASAAPAAFSPVSPAAPAAPSAGSPTSTPDTPSTPDTAASPAAFSPASPAAPSAGSPTSTPDTPSTPDPAAASPAAYSPAEGTTSADGSEVVELTEAEELPAAARPFGIDVDDVPVDGSQVVELADADRLEPADVDDVIRATSPGSAGSAGFPIGSADDELYPLGSAEDDLDEDFDSEDDQAGDHDGWTLASLPDDLVDELGPLVPDRSGASAYADEPSTDTPVSIAVAIRQPEIPAAGRQALSVLCPEGHANPTNYVRCRACGAELSQPARMITCPPLGRLRLSSGQAVTLDRPVLVGRQPSSVDVSQLEGQSPTLVTVPSPEQLISRNHVLIELDEWSVLARNFSGGNGTVLNRAGASPQKLPYSEPLVLRNGDVLDLGDGQSLVLEDLP